MTIDGAALRVFAVLFLFSGVFAVIAPAVPAHAAEQLGFGAKIGDSSRLALSRYLQRDISDGLLIAPVDLNEDGLDEFIVHDKNCGKISSPCSFMILSENESSIQKLGDIPARALALGNDHTKGVRSLLAYQSTVNDYNYTVYVWEPNQGQYIMAGQK